MKELDSLVFDVIAISGILFFFIELGLMMKKERKLL
jgi:hypothetical protein